MTTTCLDESRVLAFLEGALSDTGRTEVQAHVAACSACAELMTWAAAELTNHSRAPNSDGRPFVGHLMPGARVDRYQILGAVGRGGMGEVYAAYHPDLDRRIALKVLFESGADSTERRARLLREARAIARLSHPNVITVHDAGTFDDHVYIAMEFVEGETVDVWLRARPRGWREILAVFIAAGRGLAAAHAAGIVHRDFKPQNVMVGQDGSVRVMDFGLARLAEEPPDAPDVRPDRDGSGPNLTKAGALVGTIAYMAPEQFRRQEVDARADQFSFCVALHEALRGGRPTVAHLSNRDGKPPDRTAPPSPDSGPPAWLRGVVVRGLSDNREQRFPSMDALLAAVARGQARLRWRASLVAVGAMVLLLSLGGWRLAGARRVSCVVPSERLAAVWPPGEDSSARRQAVHRAFAASGRPAAETTWQHFSKAVDDYVRQWSAMYVQTCEATHVRGEQSGGVLDLRMTCLAENLDEVRALTDALTHADAETVPRSLTAAQGLSPVSRCADLAALRSAVPLPRNPKTLAEVQAVRASLRSARSLSDLGNFRAAARIATELRPRVEALGYKPLLAELLQVIGVGTEQFEPARGESILESAFLNAEASGDDVIAAQAAAALTYAVGYQLGRTSEGKRWAKICEAILERMGGSHERLRAWFLTGYSTVLAASGDWAGASALAEESVRLKEHALGPEHPDVAISLSNVALIRLNLGHLDAALRAVDRAVEIQDKSGDPDESVLANSHANRGDILAALGRYSEAEREFDTTLKVIRDGGVSDDLNTSQALNGLGLVQLGLNQPAVAVPYLEQALALRQAHEVDKALTAETRFALARALWESERDRRRARALAVAARDAYATIHRTEQEQTAGTWLETHQAARR